MEALELHAAQQGHSPQHVGRGLVRSRRAGIFGGCMSAVVRALITGPINPHFLAGPTAALQKHARVSSIHSLAAADDYARRTRDPYGWNPWPTEFDVGRQPNAATVRRGART